MPSSFSSTAQGPTFSTASSTLLRCSPASAAAAGPRSARSRPAPPARGPAARVPPVRGRRPASPPGGPPTRCPVAAARPSTAAASSAPCRTSPVSSPSRYSCSGAVAAPNRSWSSAATRLSARAGHLAHRGQCRVHRPYGQCRPLSGRRPVAQRGPAHAQSALGRRPPGRRWPPVRPGLGGPEELGEQGCLARAGGGPGDLPGHAGDLGEEHASIVRRAARSCSSRPDPASRRLDPAPGRARSRPSRDSVLTHLIE